MHDYLEKQIQEAIRVKELNVELMEHLAFTGHWILSFCQKNNIHPPNTDKLLELIGRSRVLIEKMDAYDPTVNTHS
jgi:hypothetical protein